MLIILVAAVLLVLIFGTMAIQPLSAKLRKIVRFLSFGGFYLFVVSMLLLGYLFDSADSFGGPPPDFYTYVWWTGVAGVLIGPVCTLAALIIAVFCKIKKI